VRTQEPPRTLLGDLSVGMIAKAEIATGLVLEMYRVPSEAVLGMGLIIPETPFRRGPAFLQLQFTQLYL